MAMTATTEMNAETENFAAPCRGPIDAIKTCLRKYFDFTGRASRSEFWWFAPLPIGAHFVVFVFPFFVFPFFPFISDSPRFLWWFWGVSSVMIATTIPMLAAGARRLQDAGKSPWWLLLYSLQVSGGLPWGMFVMLFFIVAIKGGVVIGLFPWLALTFLPTWILIYMWGKKPDLCKNKYDTFVPSRVYKIALPFVIIGLASAGYVFIFLLHWHNITPEM